MRIRALRAPRSIPTLALIVAAVGCAPPDGGEGEGEGEGPPQCGSVRYVAFDEANYENQQLRVGAHTQMVALMDAAKEDASKAAANFADAEELYTDTASLADKVAGRNDHHLSDTPNVGADMDADIRAALAAGAAATTELEANLAKQVVDKSLTEFFFLSVHYEMVLGARDKWDEAFGYFGATDDNAEGDAQGFAAVAKKRDAGNGTTLREEIFNGLVDGSCELAKILEAEGTESIDVTQHESLWSIVEETDLAMQKVLAYSAGHEAFDMQQLQEDLTAAPGDAALEGSMQVKLAELKHFFLPLERLMTAAGGESDTRATMIRGEIDAAEAAADNSWMASFDAAGVEQALEAEYAIDIVD
jgi:hypothetical protein